MMRPACRAALGRQANRIGTGISNTLYANNWQVSSTVLEDLQAEAQEAARAYSLWIGTAKAGFDKDCGLIELAMIMAEMGDREQSEQVRQPQHQCDGMAAAAVAGLILFLALPPAQLSGNSYLLTAEH